VTDDLFDTCIRSDGKSEFYIMPCDEPTNWRNFCPPMHDINEPYKNCTTPAVETIEVGSGAICYQRLSGFIDL
jgi:hypothetical protein